MKQLLILFAAVALCGSALAQSGNNIPQFTGGIFATATTPNNGTSEIDTITIGGTPTAGTFTLTFGGQTTAAITWSATNGTLVSNIDTALEALGTVGASNVTTAVGTMTAGIGTITVTFAGNLAKLDVGAITSTSSLTGTSPTLAVTTTTAGVTADGRNQVSKGSLCVALDTGIIYGNTGTAIVPVWGKVSAQ